MPQFAANLSLMYADLPFLDRFEAAAKDGFKAVEYQFAYAFDPRDIAARLRGHGLQLVLLNAPPGGVDAASISHATDVASDKGTACVPGREAEFRAGVVLALRCADALDCPRVHLMAGLIPACLAREDVQATYVNNLRWAAAEAGKAGRDVMIEPINVRDFPRYFLNRQDHAHEIVAAVSAPNLKVQMDLYHCQIVEGDVAMKIRKYLPTGAVGHIQIAGVPQRQEPDAGELNYAYLMGVLDEVAAQSGWQGWVGCEYRPRLGLQSGGTTAGLGWMSALTQLGRQPRR
ncbi:MAG: TIM barrel protein [Polaromonas sp.]|nr:TIM barrel protein [Polaromonas sp.]